MSGYDQYFSTQSITRTVCQIRVARARSIHERRFVRKIFKLGPEDSTTSINRLLPPRREWARFRPRKKARPTVTNPTQIALERCVSWHRRQPTQPPWLARLEALISSIQTAVLQDENFQFQQPNISAQLKKGHDYRAIASFSRTEDKVVDILNAKYLREKLDTCFEDSSVAFRGRRPRPLNRDSAIDEIYRVRSRNPEAVLFVTECDIRGFFDCIHHRVAKDSLKRVIAGLSTRDSSVEIDLRSIKVFDAYLACYSFSRTVLAKEADLKQATNDDHAVYKWPLHGDPTNPRPDNLGYFHARPKQARVGVPQGGAHSCLIANLVLDIADKEVSLDLFSGRGESVYLRYCDDIIIISPNRSACESATQRYKSTLEFLKLPFHQPVALTGSLPQFYNDSKTKEVYEWGQDRASSQFPWIQFLGYQIRFDGHIRVRPSSIKKHKDKINTLRYYLCNELKNRRAKVSSRRVLYRFNSKVWAFSSGRVNPSQPNFQPLPMCWASGFRQLGKREFSSQHIRGLDRHVGKNRRRLKRFLKKSKTGATTEQKNKRHLKYFGAPFSHLRQFLPKRSEKLNLYE